MKLRLDEAIKIQESRLTSPFVRANPSTVQSTSLGIEAMKRVQNMRISPCTTADELLPGETEE